MNQHDNAVTDQKDTFVPEAIQRKFSLSKTTTRTFDEILKDSVMWTSDVTGIPLGLLRTPHIWEQPIDLMIYLHFFTHSFGRNRRWCNMGILDLQKFCAGPGKIASRNTIRESLSRLISKDLIECIKPEATNQKTKMWLVRTPVEAELGSCKKETWVSAHRLEANKNPEPKADQPSPGNQPETTVDNNLPAPEPGSKIDPVIVQPGQNSPQTGSTVDPEGVNNQPGEGQNLILTGSIDAPYKYPLKDPFIDPSKDPSLKHPPLSETFEKYFSKIRAPKAERNERACWAEIQMRNPDVTQEEFLECFKLVSNSKDSKGKPISMKFLWMANGFDTILLDAKEVIRSRKRREEEKLQVGQRAKEPAVPEKQASPEVAEQGMNALRAILGRGTLKSFGQPQKPQSEKAIQERRALLIAQAEQLQQIENFGRL